MSGDGRLILNGQRDLRGVGVHEDSQQQGFAVDNAFRERLVAETKAVGATAMRTHYPMHPYTHELADREGVMIWSEVPVYAIKTANLAKNLVTTQAAKELEKNIIANQNHPSVFVWSIANELSVAPRPDAGELHQERRPPGQGARPQPPRRHRGRRLPRGRLPEGLRAARHHRHQRLLRLVPRPPGLDLRPPKLLAYLDQVRTCYPEQAVMITEFGAEANRDGPVEEKGTWAFQQDFVNYHLATYRRSLAQRRDLLGAQRVPGAPGLGGRQPAPDPPFHQKGLLSYGDFARKPAWEDLRRNDAR